MGNLILNSLEIRNFRGFRHLQIERLGRINLVVGKNNIGKTSLLEALQLYVRRSAIPMVIWEILRARREIRRPLLDVEDMLSALKSLFYGRQDIRPDLQPIRIGPIHFSDQALSIAIDWSLLEILQDGSQTVRPLQPGEDYTSSNLIPRFTIQIGGESISYPIDPSLSQQILRLNSKEISHVFLPGNGLDESQAVLFWDKIALTSLEDEVINALRIIAPGVESLSFVGDSTNGKQERISIVKVKGIDDRLSVRSLGDGMQRVLSIVLALVNSRNGILLIDEFENGLYYSVQPDLWQHIFRLARLLNVQIFATTHSWDCIEAFQKAIRGDQQEESFLIRLESHGDAISATVLDKRKLSIARREQIEVR